MARCVDLPLVKVCSSLLAISQEHRPLLGGSQDACNCFWWKYALAFTPCWSVITISVHQSIFRFVLNEDKVGLSALEWNLQLCTYLLQGVLITATSHWIIVRDIRLEERSTFDETQDFEFWKALLSILLIAECLKTCYPRTSTVEFFSPVSQFRIWSLQDAYLTSLFPTGSIMLWVTVRNTV